MTTNVRISRWHRPDCTLGVLESGGFRCFTLELPDRCNLPDISCVPPGKYKAFKRESPANGACIELEDVPARSHIQIHVGNFTRDIRGCILVGSSIAFLDTDEIPDVTNSGATMAKLLRMVPEHLTVEIQ